jgi:hypothetical protein
MQRSVSAYDLKIGNAIRQGIGMQGSAAGFSGARA